MFVTEDNLAHTKVVGLGGQCFLEHDLLNGTDMTGPWGLFNNVLTTPKVVAAMDSV